MIGPTSTAAPVAAPSRSARAPDLVRRTVTGLGWVAGAAGVQTLLSLGIVMVLSRVLTPADFGLLAMAIAFVAFADLVARRSIGAALVQRDALDEGHVSTGFTLAVGLGLGLALTLFGLAPAIGGLLGEPALGPVLQALTPVLVLSATAVVSEHLLRRHLRFRSLTAANVAAQAIGNGLVAIGLALLGCGVWALVGGLLARHASFAAITVCCQPPVLRPRITWRKAADLLRTGAGFWTLSLLNRSALHGTHLSLGWTLGPAALGLYTLAERLARVATSLSPVFGEVLFPAISRRQHRADRLADVLRNGSEMLLLVALPAGGAIALAAPEIVAVVLGEQWDAAVPAVCVLAPAVALLATGAVHVAVIRARGAVYRESWRRALYTGLLLGCIWAGSRWGIAGVAAGVAGAGLVGHVLLVQLSLAQVGMPCRQLLRCHLPGLWASAWATPALWLTLDLARDASLPALVSLVLGGAAWAAAGAAALRLAPQFASPQCLPWVLDRVPFGKLGVPGRLLRTAIARMAIWHAHRDVRCR